MAATKSRSSRSTTRKRSTKKATVSRKTSASKKRTRKKTATRGSKRDTVKAKNATFYARREAGGEFREMDEKGKSLAADRRQRAKATAVSGMGDRGDRRTKKR